MTIRLIRLAIALLKFRRQRVTHANAVRYVTLTAAIDYLERAIERLRNG